MANKYIATGLNLLDQVVIDGSEPSPVSMGGSVIYGLCGMLFWTDDIKYATRAGEDFMETYGNYLVANGLATDAINPVSEKTPKIIMVYDKEGNALHGDELPAWAKRFDNSRWRPTVEDVAPYVGAETKGLYISSPPPGYCKFWDGFFEMKEKYDFKVMWEPNPPCTMPEHGPATRELCKKVEMASFNLTEGNRLFGTNSEEELIEELKTLGPELCLLRVGARGMYVIADGKVCFVPSAPLPEGESVVDVTGCGNSSTAAAMVAYIETNGDLARTGIMANISSSYILRQVGPTPPITDARRAEAAALAEKLFTEGHYEYL